MQNLGSLLGGLLNNNNNRPANQGGYGYPAAQSQSQAYNAGYPGSNAPAYVPAQGYQPQPYPVYQQSAAPVQPPPSSFGYAAPPRPPTYYQNASPAGQQYQYGAPAAPSAGPPSRMKRALFIGINYTGTSSALAGCQQDVRNMKAFLDRRCGQVEALILTDEQHQGPLYQPTRQNILNAMQWLVSGAMPGDRFFFHFSGHGSKVRDTNGDELDGYDQTICPLDYNRAGQILDDEMHAIMCAPLPQGCQLTAIFDCCHSGTMLDLPFTYYLDNNDQPVEQNNLQVGGKILMQGGMQWMRGDAIGAVSSAISGIGMILQGGQQKGNQSQRPIPQGGGLGSSSRVQKTTRAAIFQWSGCRDDQTSADTSIGNMPTGAMSWAFITALSTYPNATQIQILREVRKLLRNKYSQIPQLSTGFHLDLNIPLVF